MKIIATVAILFFAIPIACYVVGFFIFMWKQMLGKIMDGARHISYHLPTIQLNHGGPGGRKLIWDYANKTMYGHPEGVKPIEE